MDVVTSVRSCLSSWTKGGESECRNILISPHCNPSDPNCADVLTTAYHTLLCCALSTWSPKDTLTADTFLAFVQSVLDGLPSSSSASASNSCNAALFGEIVVDMVWSIDAELDEILADTKAIANVEQVSESALKAKQDVEKDKETLAYVVKMLLASGTVDATVCRERLEMALVANIGLIADKAAFEKKEIRTRTGLFYKQNKFNLLREQSEGYSKLTAELTSSLSLPHNPATGYPTESYALIEDRARPVWGKVISLIGYFDLDPNRALDIILDVLSVHLATHYSFFLALLSFSPWSGVYKPPNRSSMTFDPVPNQYRDKSLDEVLLLAEAQQGNEHGSSPISHATTNPRVMAQVLGFKFGYYQSSDVSESAPKSLYLTAALLIREGFIALEDLYPHVSPDDTEMEQVHKDYETKVKERISGAKISQLAMAAPLEAASTSSSSSKARPSTPAEPKKPAETPDIPPQKVGLLSALLAVGALQPAIAIMSKFPWVVDAYPEIADLMIRVMKHSISPLYESTMVTKERNRSFTQPRARYGAGGVSVPPSRKAQLTLWAPTPPSTHTIDFVFFFPDWALRVPLCSSLDDLVDIIEPLMRFIGLHISRDPLFVTKFTRLGRTHLISTVPHDPETKKPSGEPDPDHPIRQFWLKVLRLYLLPALPLIRGNAVCTVEVWNIIRQYETTVRWRLYGEWKTTTYQSHPELRIRQVQADRESKGILRRLSHNTIDTLSGTVAKLAHSNPCIFFTVAVGQIMAYDNLANVVIQALRYVTNMGFDVLVFIILDALANPHKERLKDDGVNTSDWLQSLASFTGMLFRRYSADLSPVLRYIVHQLYSGQTTEIVVLRELIWKMAGIEPLPDLSDSQITAMAGGPTLRVEAVASDTRGARLDPGDAVLKGPQRLGKALLDSSLALPLLIQVAQQRQACVFRAPDAHLKSLASLYDTTHGVLLQYLELLTTPAVVSSLDYSQKVLPPLAELGDKYGICAPVCMQIIRPMLNGLLLKAALVLQDQERVANEEEEKRLKAALKAKREPSTTTSRVSSPSIGATSATKDTPVDQKSVLEISSAEDVSMETDSPVSPWLPELSAIFDDIKKIAPGNAYDVMGPGFYVTFWQLSTYDLIPPGAKYDEEGSALRALSRQEDSKYIAADRSSDRAKRLTASSHRVRRARYNDFVNLLAQEYKEQAASRAFTIKRLAREKQHWFAGGVKATVLISSLIEHCIQPRSLLSPMDADFCAQFIKVLHTQGTPGFSTLMCYDKLLGDHVKVVVFSCSEYEARNYGRFLVGILKDLWKWQQDEELYKQDNRTKSGGKTVLLPGMQMKWSNKITITPEDLLSWPALKTIMKKWHRKLGKCLLDCIQTGDFMHVYNAIIVLKEILPVFPLAACTDVGPVLDQVMQTFLEKEERGDLKILGRAYAASLKKREALWAVAKPIVPKPTGAPSSPQPLTPSSTPLPTEKTRISSIPSGPASASAGDTRRSSSSAATPSAPRAQLASTNGTSQTTSDRPNDTRLAMGSIPRPEVVKRVRPDKSSQSPRPDAEGSLKAELMDVDRKHSTAPTSTNNGDLRTSTKSANATARKDTSRPQTPNSAIINKEPPQSPRHHREDKQPRVEKVMPPPSAPSQTLSAQELRETAKQSIANRPDKTDDRTTRPSNDSRSQNGSANASPVPRRRSPSPPAGPGTRNGSADSRASGGRPRSDRGSGDSNDRLDDRKSNRDSRQESHSLSVGRRDSRSERSGRERGSVRETEKDKDAEKDRDRDRIRDRHGDKEKERDRDKDKDRRERDRERDRERERDRDRDRDRDRHRRDDKDRDRDVRKERDLVGRETPTNAVPPGPDSRGLPLRPDASRHRDPPHDDALGKRRRTADDEPDRSSKRSSRKDGHRDDRSRRPAEKESHDRPRDSDRRRTDRNASENDRGSQRSDDKRVLEGPSKSLPPSAPRAMSSTDISRGTKTDSTPTRDRDWKAQRDVAPHLAAESSSVPEPNVSGGSLRSRISDKEVPRSLVPAPANSYRPDPPPHADDDRDNSRKRTVSDREQDASDSASGPGAEQPAQPPKRPRINRNRYQSSQGNFAIAKKLLQTDPQAGDKTRSGRKD